MSLTNGVPLPEIEAEWMEHNTRRCPICGHDGWEYDLYDEVINHGPKTEHGYLWSTLTWEYECPFCKGRWTIEYELGNPELYITKEGQSYE